MSNQFLNSVVRGAGYTIGRNLVNGSFGGSRRSGGSRRGYEKSQLEYKNSEINRKLNVSLIDELENGITKIKQETDYIRNDYGFKYNTWSYVLLYFFVIFPITFMLSGMFLSLFIKGHPLITGIIAFLFASSAFGWFPIVLGYEKRNKKKKTIEADLYYENAKSEMDRKIDTAKKNINDIRVKYGEEAAAGLENRSVSIGLPLENFTFFFGSPSSIEETENHVTYIYGTSKMAGDWFRFKSGVLSEYSIK